MHIQREMETEKLVVIIMVIINLITKKGKRFNGLTLVYSEDLEWWFVASAAPAHFVRQQAPVEVHFPLIVQFHTPILVCGNEKVDYLQQDRPQDIHPGV